MLTKCMIWDGKKSEQAILRPTQINHVKEKNCNSPPLNPHPIPHTYIHSRLEVNRAEKVFCLSLILNIGHLDWHTVGAKEMSDKEMEAWIDGITYFTYISTKWLNLFYFSNHCSKDYFSEHLMTNQKFKYLHQRTFPSSPQFFCVFFFCLNRRRINPKRVSSVCKNNQ